MFDPNSPHSLTDLPVCKHVGRHKPLTSVCKGGSWLKSQCPPGPCLCAIPYASASPCRDQDITLESRKLSRYRAGTHPRPLLHNVRAPFDIILEDAGLGPSLFSTAPAISSLSM